MRQITKQEEQAYRLCHHEFEGKTIKEAAVLMSIHVSKVRRLLKSMKRKSPQLFPILTKRQYMILKLYLGNGDSQQIIARKLKTTQSNIAATIQRMKEKGIEGLDISGVGNTVSYTPDMDKHVKQKF